MKDWKKIFHANEDQKKSGVAVLISDKIDFEIKALKIMILNIYASNIGAPQYVRQMLTSMKV